MVPESILSDDRLTYLWWGGQPTPLLALEDPAHAEPAEPAEPGRDGRPGSRDRRLW